MTPEIEQMIRAEIERLRDGPFEIFKEGHARVKALEWVLSLAKPQEAAPGDDDEKIVEAMLDVWYPGEVWRTIGLPSARIDMRAALAVARQHLEPQIRAKALDEAAALFIAERERLMEQIEHNKEYTRRTGRGEDNWSYANESCRASIYHAEQSIKAILALKDA